MIGNQPNQQQPSKPLAQAQQAPQDLPEPSKKMAKEEGERFVQTLLRAFKMDSDEQLQALEAKIMKMVDEKNDEKMKAVDAKIAALKGDHQKMQENLSALRSEVLGILDKRNEDIKKEVEDSFKQFDGTMRANLEAVGNLEVQLRNAKIESRIIFPEKGEKKQEDEKNQIKS